jgi:hypothetical protein
MNSILRHAFFIALCGLLMIQIAAAQVESPRTDTGKTPKPVATPSSKGSEIVFPEIEGWKKLGVQKYPTPELGYSVGYQSEEAGAVTIYIYNGGLKNIPSDVTGNIIKDEIKRAKNDIHQAGKAGFYQDVTEIKNETVTLGGTTGKVKALYSLFNITKGRILISEIYLFGHQNNFIKIRASRPMTTNEVADKALAKLFAEIDRLFSK